MLVLLVQTMLAAVLDEAHHEGEDLKIESGDQRLVASMPDLNARCCQPLCTRYYVLRQPEDVWQWLEERRRFLTCITNEGKRVYHQEDTEVAKASLLIDQGDYEK